MKALLVARKSFLEMLRELQLVVLELVLPLAFLLVTYASYNSPLQSTYDILIYDPAGLQNETLAIWQNALYSNGTPLFDMMMTDDLQAAEEALKDKSADILVKVTEKEGIPDFNMRGDALNMKYYRASTLLTNLARRNADEKTDMGMLYAVKEMGLSARSTTGVARGPQTTYDLYAPGMIVFAILMLIPQTAMLVSREIRWKTLRRLRLTRLTALDLLGGISLSQLAVAIVQVLIIFLVARWTGFNNQGSIWLAMLVAIVLSISAIGMGLWVACFVENDSQAANIGATVTMMQVFLSGAFYQLPPITLFNLAGHEIDLFDIFPATHSFMAFQQVLTYGDGLPQIAFRLGATLLLSGLYFVIGIYIFQKKQMAEI